MSNAIDDDPTSLPKLLRKFADQIEELEIDPMDILDLTISSEILEDVGPWWSGTLYWSPPAED